jgi:hypothetical protein
MSGLINPKGSDILSFFKGLYGVFIITPYKRIIKYVSQI